MDVPSRYGLIQPELAVGRDRGIGALAMKLELADSFFLTALPPGGRESKILGLAKLSLRFCKRGGKDKLCLTPSLEKTKGLAYAKPKFFHPLPPRGEEISGITAAIPNTHYKSTP